MNHKRYSSNVLLLVFALLLFFGCSKPIRGKTPCCQKWLQQLDPRMGNLVFLLHTKFSDQEVMDAIKCMLTFEGNTHPARFSGVSSLVVSQFLPQATVELASLHYISYLFTGTWRHADGIALWDAKARINPKGSIQKAYHAYRKWFEKVKVIGLNEVRKQGLNPLAGSGLSWYGR